MGRRMLVTLSPLTPSPNPRHSTHQQHPQITDNITQAPSIHHHCLEQPAHLSQPRKRCRRALPSRLCEKQCQCECEVYSGHDARR